jgi:hypothetical protein
LELTEVVLKVYSDLKEKESQNLFKKSYPNLKESEKVKIDELIPKNIVFLQPN